MTFTRMTQSTYDFSRLARIATLTLSLLPAPGLAAQVASDRSQSESGTDRLVSTRRLIELGHAAEALEQLDKLAGALARSGQPAANGCLVLTSRVSIELVQKAARMGARMVVAVSAETINRFTVVSPKQVNHALLLESLQCSIDCGQSNSIPLSGDQAVHFLGAGKTAR